MSRGTLRRLDGTIIVDNVTLDVALEAVRAELGRDRALRFKLQARGTR